MDEQPDLGDLGKWPKKTIGSHAIVRHAYDGVLSVSARLYSFATGRDPGGVVGEQQELLAVDDLVLFAIHARRLIDNTISMKEAVGVLVQAATDNEKKYITITRIINTVIHNRTLLIYRNLGRLRMMSGEQDFAKIYDGYNTPVDPVCSVTSDKGGGVTFKMAHMIEIFQENVLNRAIDLCAEQMLFLERFD